MTEGGWQRRPLSPGRINRRGVLALRGWGGRGAGGYLGGVRVRPPFAPPRWRDGGGDNGTGEI